jgi:hypothetical protein
MEQSRAAQSDSKRIIRFQVDREGAARYQKVSYPLRYGRYTRIETEDFCFEVNLNGEIKYIHGRRRDWPHPSEWLKRTAGHDWVYYYAGGYADIADCLGEYYLPCLPYPTNSLWARNPFADRPVREALAAWRKLPGLLPEPGCLSSARERRAVADIMASGPASLWQKSLRLFSVLQARVSVLPPDARHVDYDVIPVILADGCLYNCGFCSVKSQQPFGQRSRGDVQAQLRGLRRLYGNDLSNYCSLFFGLHDALHCDRDLIEYALETGFDELNLADSYMRDHTLLLSGSVDSLLRAPERLFAWLEASPFRVYINLGLESADQATLDLLRKPVPAGAVWDAFRRMQELNDRYTDLEVTANFVLGCDLPQSHYDSLSELTDREHGPTDAKGTLYLSPLTRHNRLEQLRLFKDLKRRSRLPMYLYLLQRL